VTAAVFGSGVPLVVDTSAWHRQGQKHINERWKATVRSRLLVSCPAAALEILAGARDEREFEIVDGTLASLPQAPVTASACRAAQGAMRELGARRRLPAIDYLIAAAAAERGFGVLHADGHFDLLAGVLEFESVNVEAGKV
jgi:predicted nucleic acid-binding protein